MLLYFAALSIYGGQHSGGGGKTKVSSLGAPALQVEICLAIKILFFLQSKGIARSFSIVFAFGMIFLVDQIVVDVMDIIRTHSHVTYKQEGKKTLAEIGIN